MSAFGNLLSQVFGMGGMNGQFQMGGMGLPIRPGVFVEKYHAYSPAYWNSENRDKLEKGDKIVLPASSLEKLTQLHISFPIMFRITHDNPILPKRSHCSVLEFTAPEGHVYLPLWMIDNLGLDPSGDSVIELKTVELPKGNFVQFQAHETKFAMLSNPRVVLEKSLRSYSCLTVGDTIQVEFANKIYKLDVTEVKPSQTDPPAISIIETDIKVDFKEPRDYKEWEKEQEEKKLQNLQKISNDESKDDIVKLHNNHNINEKNEWNKALYADDEEQEWIKDANKLVQNSKADYFKSLESEGSKGQKLKQPSSSSNVSKKSNVNSSNSIASLSSNSSSSKKASNLGLNKAQRGAPLGLKNNSNNSNNSNNNNNNNNNKMKNASNINNNINNNKMEDKNKKNKKVEEIVGNMRYIYEVDDNGERKLLRRLPIRDQLGGQSYSLK